MGGGEAMVIDHLIGSDSRQEHHHFYRQWTGGPDSTKGAKGIEFEESSRKIKLLEKL